MASTRPFAYNLGGPISGTTSFGSTLISGDIEVDYSEDYGGVKWWMGPDEDLGYVIGNSRPGGQPVPSGVTGTAQLGFWRSKFKTDESFLNLANYIGSKNGQPSFANTTDAENWLNSQGYYSSYNLPTPTPTPTITNTPTPSQTSIPPTPTNTETPTPTPTPSVTTTTTPTVTQTPTNTPTPSTSPIPVTGYSFNLVQLPYNFPTSGNSILNNAGGISSGSTDPNVLATGARGFYFNSFDSNGIDRTDYYSGFTGQSVTITLSQTGSTAIYSGDTNSFKQWIQAPTGTGFVFGAGIGVPPVGVPSGNAVLIQSASTSWNFGVPVYVSLVINVPITPTPTPTNTDTPTNTPTPSVTETQTPTVTPTNTQTSTVTQTTTPSPTPTNPTLLQILNETTGSRTITSVTLDGVTQPLSSGSYPITAGNNGFALTHGTNSNPNGVVFNIGGSGTFDLYSYLNGALVNYLASYNSSTYTMGGVLLQTSDQVLLRITDPGAVPTPTPTLTSTPTPSPNPKFYVYNNSTSRTITSIQGNGPWNLSTGTYPITTSEVGYGGSHPSLTFLGLDQLVIQFGGSGAIDISITKNGSLYSPSSNVSPTNVTASQINYFINNPSDVIQTSDIIVFTIVDTI